MTGFVSHGNARKSFKMNIVNGEQSHRMPQIIIILLGFVKTYYDFYSYRLNYVSPQRIVTAFAVVNFVDCPQCKFVSAQFFDSRYLDDFLGEGVVNWRPFRTVQPKSVDFLFSESFPLSRIDACVCVCVRLVDWIIRNRNQFVMNNATIWPDGPYRRGSASHN